MKKSKKVSGNNLFVPKVFTFGIFVVIIRVSNVKGMVHMAEYRVNVLESEDMGAEIVARVRYNQDLDYWNGQNFQNGGVGRHLGVSKLKDGRYALIYGTNWQGEKDYALLASDEEVLREILKSGNAHLLKMKKFAKLNELYKATMIEEDEDDEN